MSHCAPWLTIVRSLSSVYFLTYLWSVKENGLNFWEMKSQLWREIATDLKSKPVPSPDYSYYNL